MYKGGFFMCGITAISANKEALPFLLQGLEKLEYRGYDSAGITTIEGNNIDNWSNHFNSH